MARRSEGRVALITGGARGIGAATAERLEELRVDGLTVAHPRSGRGITDVDLVVPLESMPDPRDVIHVSLPRGRLRTGFERPLGELRMSFRQSVP